MANAGFAILRTPFPQTPHPQTPSSKVAAAVLAPSVAARATLSEMVDMHGVSSGNFLRELLLKKQGTLLTQDAAFVVEIGFLSELAGDRGRSRCQMKILASLPSATIALSIDEAVAKLSTFTGGELFKYVSRDAQQDARLVEDILNSIGKAMEPSSKCFATDFMLGVKARLEWFIVAETASDSSGSSGGAQTLRGKPALMRIFCRVQQIVEAGRLGDITMRDLADFHRYPWLLSDEQLAQVSTWTQAILSRLSVPRARAKTMPTNKSTVKQKRSGDQKLDEIDELFT